MLCVYCVCRPLRAPAQRSRCAPCNAGLSTLKTLYIDHNLLKELPETIGDLGALETLHAHSNQLHALPQSVARMHALHTLFVFNNPKMSKPPAVVALHGAPPGAG